MALVRRRDDVSVEREMRIALNMGYAGRRSLSLIRKFCAYLLLYGWSEDKIKRQLERIHGGC